MNLGVLSKNREFFPTTQLLNDIAQRRNVHGVFLSSRFLSPFLKNDSIDVLFANQSLKSLNGIIPRIGRTQTEIGVLCLQQFELMNIPTTISSQALYIARDKFRCYQTLLRVSGVQVPKTVLVNNSYLFDELMTNFKFPVVIKIPDATQGVGTILAPSRQVAREVVEALFLRYDTSVMIQEYLRGLSYNGKDLIEDIRVLVVGRSILGAMRRIAPKGEWRTNYAQGATCVPHKLSEEDEELVMRIVERIDIEVAGIDLFPTNRGLFLLEVNACPGWKAFEQAHPDCNVAKNIVDYLLVKIRQ
ncbi:MAG: RimK family alpha-L-glutamate ligase [Promethearchaeota archaeon]